jgi:putative Mg2+ transporter-C (MgtC) family protein
MIAEAGLLTFVVLLANTALRPLVDGINRIPTEGRTIEATYSVMVTVAAGDAGPIGDLVVEHLEAAQLQVAELDVTERGEDRVEIAATLVATNVPAGELDAITDHLAKVHGIEHATWQARTHD